MTLFRFLSARLRGYFWLPCPVCGKNYGGNEKGGGTLMRGPHGGVGTCPRCADSEAVKSAMKSAMAQMQATGYPVYVQMPGVVEQVERLIA